jgi:hypothetical protein
MFSALICGELDFYREDLVFRIEDGYFHVDGDYYFRNRTDREIKKYLSYPFPQKKELGIVDSLYSFNKASPEINLLVNFNQKAGVIKLHIAAKDSVVYKIGYRQKITSNIVEYILMTTYSWGKGFEYASYKLITDNSIEIESLPFDKPLVEEIEERKIYSWEFTNFLPTGNFVVLLQNSE